MTRRFILLACAGLLVICAAATSRAQSWVCGPTCYNIYGLGDPTNLTAQIHNFSLTNVTLPDARQGQMFTFTLTNTSNQGSLTAMAFALPGTRTGFEMISPPPVAPNAVGWWLNNNEGELHAGTPNGTVGDFSINTGDNFRGGKTKEGMPWDPVTRRGIVLRDSQTFQIFTPFSMGLSGFSGLTAHEIAVNVWVRFQGTGIVGSMDGNGSDVGAVPEPSTILLLGISVIGVAVGAYKKHFPKPVAIDGQERDAQQGA